MPTLFSPSQPQAIPLEIRRDQHQGKLGIVYEVLIAPRYQIALHQRAVRELREIYLVVEMDSHYQRVNRSRCLGCRYHRLPHDLSDVLPLLSATDRLAQR